MAEKVAFGSEIEFLSAGSPEHLNEVGECWVGGVAEKDYCVAECVVELPAEFVGGDQDGNVVSREKKFNEGSFLFSQTFVNITNSLG